MNAKQFRAWANKNPNIFNFIDELQVALRRAELRQKVQSVMKIQRAVRSMIGADKPDLTVVVQEAVKAKRASLETFGGESEKIANVLVE